MKKFWKVLLLLGLGCIAAGFLLAAVLSVGFWDEIVSNRNYFSINEDNYWEFFEVRDYYKPSRNGLRYGKEDANQNYFYEVPEEEQITELRFEFALGEVSVLSGDTFSVRVRDMFEGAISSEVKDGIWYIKDALLKEGSVFSGYAPEIEITVPKGILLEKAIIRVEAGDFYIDELLADSVELWLKAGRMKVDSLTARRSLTVENGVGEIIIYSLDGKNLSLDNGIGATTLYGSLTGNNKIDCGIGEVKLVLTDRKHSDFGYSVDCGIGTVTVDGTSYSGMVKKSDYNRGEADFFELSCGIGRIEIELEN